MKKAFIFPGQGSQFVGMGKDLYDSFSEAKEVFQEVDDALNQKISNIIFEGPVEDLTATSNTQPALMAVSVAVTRVIQNQTGLDIDALCSYVAGHSLGEYSALCAAGSISLSETAKLLRIRGDAMQDAVPQGQGGMAALIGVDFNKAQEIADKVSDYGICQAANDNGGGQVVVSGAMKAIDKIVEVAPEYGARKAVKLPVSAPFHSSMMQPAAEIMQVALADATVESPKIPVIANVTANEVNSPEEIRDLLVQQVTGMVRWQESVIKLKNENVGELIEIGAGKVLTGLTKRIDRDLAARSIQNIEAIEEFCKDV